MAQWSGQPHRNSFSAASTSIMNSSYQSFYQPVDENQNMQSVFVEPQSQMQFYAIPPPTGGSMDSGYAGEDANPFESNVFCPDLKMSYVQNINPAAANYGAYGFVTNEQQPTGPDQSFVPIGFPTDFDPNFSLAEGSNNVSSQSPTALVTDDVVSVKSEDGWSEAASPRDTSYRPSKLSKQTRSRNDTLKRTATCPTIEGRSGSLELSRPKEGRAGRTRKRIPHTAVERRYRENLNHHLENLRGAVPNLQAAHRRRSSDANDPMKPSKCEVLMGAVGYIKRLESEVKRLKSELGE